MIAKTLFRLTLFLFLINGFFFDIGFRAIPLFFICVPIFSLMALTGRLKRLSFNYIEKSLAVFYLIGVASSLFSFSHELSARFIMGLILILVCYVGTRELLKNSSDLLTNMRVSFSFFVYFSFCYYLLGFFVVDFTKEHADFMGLTVEKGIPRFIGLNNDPNISCAALMFPLFFFMFDTKKYSKLTFLVTLFCILATLSRGGILALVIAFFALFLVCAPKAKAYFIFLFLVMGFVSGITYSYFVESLSPIIEKRVTGVATGGGRFEVWGNALQLYEMKPVFGHGIFTFREVSDFYFYIPKFAHNTYIEILVETGGLGFVSFALFCIILLANSYSLFYNAVKFRFIFPLTVAILSSMLSLSLYINPIFAFVVLLNSLFLYAYKRKKNAF